MQKLPKNIYQIFLKSYNTFKHHVLARILLSLAIILLFVTFFARASTVIAQTSTLNIWTKNNSSIFATNTGDKVGIGTTAPASQLSVGGSGSSFYTIFGTSSNDGGTTIYGINTGAGYGVEGKSNSSYGVEGVSNSGVGGYFTSPNGYALITNAGNVGIGNSLPQYKLDLEGSSSNRVVARISNSSTTTTANGLLIQLGNSSTSIVSSGNHFINFETAGLGNVGSIRGNGAKGVQYATSGNADFAEYFDKDANTNIEFGSLVCLDSNGKAVLCGPNNSNVLGVASEHPTYIGGNDNGNKSVSVALVGRVVLKVTGNFKAGDALGVSDASGVATKVTKGPLVGRALESHSGSGVDKILVVVSLSL